VLRPYEAVSGAGIMEGMVVLDMELVDMVSASEVGDVEDPALLVVEVVWVLRSAELVVFGVD
jgi:hypothetical protein